MIKVSTIITFYKDFLHFNHHLFFLPALFGRGTINSFVLNSLTFWTNEALRIDWLE